ncbi:MAG: transcriptional regulator, Fis family, partial [Bryobacterales bacterium]|nr:transcriptional regulator, Fis family [Bryobacterales bacterium]
SAIGFVPVNASLEELQEAAERCQGCDLWRHATQTVFGEGATTAAAIFVGEQPGNDEDLAGKPFVGPAGKLLDRAFEEAGIDRRKTYVTNAVKHFKFVMRGKRRIHEKPGSLEIAACMPWLQAEIQVVKPKVLVCLGATAGQAVIGKSWRVTKDRGVFVPSALAEYVMGTIHPSAILRVEDADREREMARFIEDLKLVAPLI